MTSAARLTAHPRSRAAWARLVESVPAIVQVAVTATVSYALAHYMLGHELPLFAVTVTLTSLGLSRDARPIRVAETALAITLGIALSVLLLAVIGRGWWQLLLVLLVTFAAARLLSPSPAFPIAAGVQAVLVVLLPATPAEELGRVVDALIGGGMALVATALLPRDPRRQSRADAHRLFDAVLGALRVLESSLRSAYVPGAGTALERLRGTQPLLDAWSASLDTATAVARLSPFLRRRRADFVRQRRLLRGMDLACRTLRIVARRADYLLRDGRPRPALADLLTRIRAAIEELRTAVDDPGRLPPARTELEAVARGLSPASLPPDAGISETMVLMLLRPLLVDLLAATGMREDDARALLPPVEG